MTVKPDDLLNIELLGLMYHKTLAQPYSGTEKGSMMVNFMYQLWIPSLEKDL